MAKILDKIMHNGDEYNFPVAIVSSTAPANPVQWQLRYDTANNVLKVYDGSVWQTV